MTSWDDMELPGELRDTEDRLRAQRHQPSGLELDELKRRAMRRAADAPARRGSAGRRLAGVLLVLGLTTSGATSAVIAASSSSKHDPSAAISQYQGVLPEQQPSPGSARLTGPSKCVTKRFTVRVRGQNIASVTFRINGKKVRTVKATAAATQRFQLRVNPAKYRQGINRLTARVTFNALTQKKPRTLRLTFSRCVHKKQKPRFTG